MTTPPPNDPWQQSGQQPPGGPNPGPNPGWGYTAAPYGIDPMTGLEFSDKSKIIAGILQILVPFGIGRFYTGHTGLGVAQLLVVVLTCGAGSLWPIIDGILLLIGTPTDSDGRPLRS